MQQSIEVEVTTKYGTRYIYPVCKQAAAFCRLLGGQKTLTQQNIDNIKELGFEIKVKVPKVVL